MRQTLRSSRPPRSSSTLPAAHIARPAHNPVIESWLEGIHPSTSNTTFHTTTTGYNPFYSNASKPVSDGFFHSSGIPPDVSAVRSERKWRIIQLALRATSFGLSMSALIVLLLFGADTGWERLIDVLHMPALTMSPITMAWNGADLVTAACRRSGGIPRKVHAVADCVLVMGLSVSVAFLTIAVSWHSWYWRDRDVSMEIVVDCHLMLVLIIHFYLFSIFIWQYMRASRQQRELYMPRIMFLPSGAAVMVTPRPLQAALPIARPPPIEMGPMEARSAVSRANTSQADRNRTSHTGGTENQTITAPQAPVSADTRSPTSPTPAMQAPATRSLSHTRRDVPPRRPVATDTGVPDNLAMTSVDAPTTATVQTGTRYATPWPGPDYQPDEEELRRAARGEAQAQLMSIRGGP